MEFQTAAQSYPQPSSMVPEISVQRVLAAKGTQVWSVAPGTLVFEAIRIMTERRIGALLVMSGDRLEGIFSERDYLRRVILEHRTSKTTPLEEIMTRDVVTVGTNTSLQECMRIMTERHFRHLPVVEAERVVGVLSIGDIVKESLAYQQYLLDELERYVTRTSGT